eukprot:SAG31_NODE_42527_length_271_cov_0.604651_1_plen_22_part_01
MEVEHVPLWQEVKMSRERNLYN